MTQGSAAYAIAQKVDLTRGGEVDHETLSVRSEMCRLAVTGMYWHIYSLWLLNAAGDLSEAVQKVTCSFLRRQCEERLPQHMVPARVLAIDELPQTSSGKVAWGRFNGYSPVVFSIYWTMMGR
jgi:hypothetical protein